MPEKQEYTNNNLAFIKEVAKYYMDFLETDFHKRRNPKRNIKYRSSNNLLIGLNLNKYPTFHNLVWKLINHAFNKSTLSVIKKGAYKTNISKSSLNLINLKAEEITDEQITDTINLITKYIEQAVALHSEEYEQALNASLELTAEVLKTKLVVPFISSISESLERLNLEHDNNTYLMIEELIAVFSALLENKISKIIKLLILKEKIDISKELREVFVLSDIKTSICCFFESFQIGDLFAEIYEIERNRTILDKQKFYLYFCDISYNNVKFPIFYIPFEVHKCDDLLEVDFDSQVYINKKALEYITQEYNQINNKRGQLKTISERIIYIAQHENNFPNLIGEILNEITDLFELDNNIAIDNYKKQVARNPFVRVSNDCYIALFDESDEALVNDYEEILKLLTDDNSILAEAFNKLIDDFIYKNPQPFNPTIEDEWDAMKTSDKLVFNSPIPLNSEQLQILSAIRKDKCKYITVEGPPGTGKSHTITAIVFDSILENKSVLVLSDKKEALDVVEDKITETMNQVRYDKNFQNPILRLGKTGNTYNKILATTAIEDIKNHYRAIRNDYSKLKSDIGRLSNTLKEDLEVELLAYEEININEIYELISLESYWLSKGFPIDIDEVLVLTDSAIKLEEFRKIFLLLKYKLIGDQDRKNNPLLEVLKFSINEFKDIASFEKYLELIKIITESVRKIKQVCSYDISLLAMVESFDEKSFEKLKQIITTYKNEKNWIFGYLFKKEKIENLNQKLRSFLDFSTQVHLHKNFKELERILNVFQYVKEREGHLDLRSKIKFDYLEFVHQVIVNESFLTELDALVQIGDDLKFLELNLPKYPNTMRKLGIDLDLFKTLYSNKLIGISDSDFNKLIRYIDLYQKIEKDFSNIPQFNYASQKRNIESYIITQMTFLLDGRLIDFYENNRATARVLRDIIRKKRRFPRDEFLKLKEAFPCILAGIRDYAEYIPLEPEIFDLVIIDEASQVSIAQAFPALLRAKKVLILGDKKQFSNVKTAHARTDTNREYLNNLKDCFTERISNEDAKLIKLEKFNIKTSILEFFEFITNYNAHLLKYFRGYKEIISYSNKNFYKDSLQAMKIRGKSIDDVIKFSVIDHDGKKELIQNTNTLEGEFIISELKKIKESGIKQTVGIITPHTNQQKLLVDLISKTPERDYFYEDLRLKIMTFDTCQGEERDIIFYSMVATEENDRLWGVFIKNLESVDIEDEGKIKAQRLNVGFSRAKETMHFVLSKSIDKYSGSIGDALRHYSFTLEDAKKEKSVSEVDAKSKMEPKVMNWFYQTDFWKNNKDNIEFIPQFELGKYLKQLDKSYNHPNYEIDFLLVYKDGLNKEHKIVIEYDGFREHFRDIYQVNEHNYRDYYNDSDVYRQKVLEGYGYKFLRINKFNVGRNPIATLNDRINMLIKNGRTENHFFDNIRNTIEGLENGDMKECPKCKTIKNYEDFKDPTLITGYGRFCNDCKSLTSNTRKTSGNVKAKSVTKSLKGCPKCDSRMVLRRGRYGKFYGCSKYPYCRGTRQYRRKS